MSDVQNKYVSPATAETAFNCPHCGALAKQFWYSVHSEPLQKDSTPQIFAPEKAANLDLDDIEDLEERTVAREWLMQMASGRPFSEASNTYISYKLHNMSVSKCFNCDELSVWIYDRILWPVLGDGPLPNLDLPDDIRADYEEAATILASSPRGAAALLRLAVQKLCKHLGEKGKDINADIGALVSKGLDKKVQMALDVVRVIGNNAVHPGQIDLRDDRATAEKLFALVNLIAEIMISQPKHISAMYEDLPDGVRSAIDERDAPKGD